MQGGIGKRNLCDKIQKFQTRLTSEVLFRANNFRTNLVRLGVKMSGKMFGHRSGLKILDINLKKVDKWNKTLT